MGRNPLSQGLFSRTDAPPADKASVTEQKNQEPQFKAKGLFSRTDAPPADKAPVTEQKNQNPGSSFLPDIEDAPKESIGLQVTADINGWLDTVVKVGRRKHGRKIPKQVWIQAGVELLRAMPVKWDEIRDLDELRDKLDDLSRRVSEGEYR